MRELLMLAAAAGAGWWFGRRGADQAVDGRLREMEERLRREFAPAEPVPREPAPAPLPPAAGEEEITPEIIAVISAAVAAYLGKRARIRRVRRVAAPGFNPWSQQGRVSVQASHNLMFSRRGE